jgi:anti-sigma B factor antagonist
VEGAWTVLDVGGELDLSTAPSLRQELEALIEGGAKDLVVNLEGLGFMDSSGLGVLVGAHKRLEGSGGRVALVCREGPTLKVLAITGLDRVFPIHPSVDAALGS